MPLTGDERDQLQATARAMLEQQASPTRVRALVEGSSGHDLELWRQMVELGWTTVHVPVERGGAGCGYVDLAVVAHELGRAIVPSPFLASAVLATTALRCADNSSISMGLLDSLVSGERIGTVACASKDGSYDTAQLTVAWDSANGAIRLRGSAGCVPDADLADVIVVGARSEDGVVAVFAVDASSPGIEIEWRPTTDQTRRLFTVSFDDVSIDSEWLLTDMGTPAVTLLEQVHAAGAVFAACDATGVGEKALEAASTYAKERRQFGKPIGSFQAVKHHCANMTIAVEASRAAVRGATEALDGEPHGWVPAAATAASFVGPACSEVVALGLRVHGGIGFTWEQDSHLLLKRAKLDEVLFGTTSWHRRRLADAVFPALVPGDRTTERNV